MKVLFQSRKTLFSAPGGDTTQILKTQEYLKKEGVFVDISLDLEPDVTDYDLVHVFNLMRPQELFLQVKNAKKYGKKVALSTIYGPYVEYEKKARGGILQKINRLLSIEQIEYLKVIARVVLNREWSKGTFYYLLNGHANLQRKIVNMVDVFLPNSHSEMKRVADFFKMKDFKYVSVPNAVDAKRFDYESVSISPELEKYRDCVLCVSRIEGRKNQLNIINSCKGLPYQFVFIGQAGANFHGYMNACVQEAAENTCFLGQIDHEKLPQFYKLAKVHVLASWMETPGLSSLEAGKMKCNVVVTEKGDTRDYFQDFAYYCEPDDLDSIKKAVIEAYEGAYNEDFVRRIDENYTWENTACETLIGYQMALQKK